jgi:diadenosine tetraphosphatase ApaH/serine/threonine PP2A family protein phosphatase
MDPGDFHTLRLQLDRGEIIAEDTVSDIVDRLILILVTEENLILVQSPCVICGDIHGQYEDLKLLFSKSEEDNSGTLTKRYVFMGDYVDRGRYSLNTFLLLATHKIERPTEFWLLRGNHESRQVTQQYGFNQEILSKYGHTGIWWRIMQCFDLLPVAALVANECFAVHGGLSPEGVLLSQVNGFDRRREIPSEGIAADLAWSDPEEVQAQSWRPNPRGSGYIFGAKDVKQFTHLNRLVLVARSHQLVQEGIRWYFQDPGTTRDPPGRLVDVWSAPNYGYTSGNKATFLTVDRGQKRAYVETVFDAATTRIKQEDIAPDQRYFA